MLNFFYRGVTPWAVANRSQICINRILGRLANYTYPVYCKVSKIQSKTSSAADLCRNRVIVSLTSFPARIDKVYLCINSLLRQTVKADKIVLWLADTQFPNGNGIPENLKCLVGKDFEIRFCDDLKSYKKIFYSAQQFKNDIIVTVDDDTLYPEDWLLNLINTYIKYPDCVCCYRAHRMVLKAGEIVPYSEWIGLSPNETGPDLFLVPIGVGGVLYPPTFFDNVEFDFEKIKELCPTADDLWLKVIGLRKGVKAVKVNPNSKEWFTIKKTQDVALMHINTEEKALNDVAINNLLNYYNLSVVEWI